MRLLFKTVVITLIPVWCSLPLFGQVPDSTRLAGMRVYRSLEEALAKPDSVYFLEMRRAKLTQFPTEVFGFKNLVKLDLSRNKIQIIPRDIGILVNLEELNLSRNKLETIPPEIGKLKKLKRLIVYQNVIAFLPAEIGDVENLEYLDMWGNEIETLPDEIGKLKKLKAMDLRVIEISDTRQKEFQELLPNTLIHFSNSCDCGG